MALHTPSGRWQLGVLLAFTTAIFWATLSVALRLALEQIDAFTLTWARFAFAAFVLSGWLWARGALWQFSRLSGRSWGWLILAGVMLIGNYVFFLWGLKHTSPTNAQLLIQAAPLLMAIGAILVFRERYNAWQWAGLFSIGLGLALFFSDQRSRSATNGSYTLGSGLVGLAALTWAVYALIQKQLLMRLSSPAILAFIYCLATVVLFPLAHLDALGKLDGLHWAALAYCAINTLVAYSAFAEALAHWEASRVSVVLALTPLMTIATVEITHAVAPQWVQPEQIAAMGWGGAILVVIGSAVTSMMRTRSPAPQLTIQE